MLKAIKLTKEYADTVALKGLDLEIAKGEIFCMLGANGAGKSTTINLFMGFVSPTVGKAYINETEVRTIDNPTRQWIAYIPENVMLYPKLTGLQNLEYFSGLSGKHYTQNQLEKYLANAGLESNAFKKRVDGYSKGMRQKVGIAMALAKDAKALFLDEPTSGLDPLASNEFSEILKNLSGKGVSILMVTHDLFRAKEVGDRIGIMKKGEMVKILDADSVTAVELEEIYLQVIMNRNPRLSPTQI